MKKLNINQQKLLVGIFGFALMFFCAAGILTAQSAARKYKTGDRIEVDSSVYEVVECRAKSNTGEEECDVIPHHADGLTGNLQTILATQLNRYEQQTKAAKKRQELINNRSQPSPQTKTPVEKVVKEKIETDAPTPDETEITVTAQQLYNDYKNNDEAAKRKYVGKTVRVTGANIYTVSQTKFSARFNKTYSGSTIQCLVEDLEQIPTLNPGETITLVGKPLGSMTSTGVIFEPCRVERKTANQPVKPAAKTPLKTTAGTGKVVGSWYYTALINADGTEQKLSNRESYLWLKDDGTYENRFGAIGQIGTYTAGANRLTLNRENVGAKTYTMTITGTTMTLKSGASGYKLERE